MNGNKIETYIGGKGEALNDVSHLLHQTVSFLQVQNQLKLQKYLYDASISMEFHSNSLLLYEVFEYHLF